jgi:potassium efflux system protein
VGRHLAGLAVLTTVLCQVGATDLAAVVANLVMRQLLSRVPFQRAEATEGPVLRLRRFVYLCRNLLFPLLTVLALAIAATLCDVAVPCSWVVRLTQSIGVMLVLYAAINGLIAHRIVNAACRCIGIPVAALQVFGYLDNITLWRDTLAFSAGNIRISTFVLVMAAIFGGVLFWLDRTSIKAGRRPLASSRPLTSRHVSW